MTREERLDWLCRLRSGLVWFDIPPKERQMIEETLSEEINDLQQEPCEDCISRQQAIDKMQELEDEDDEMYGCSIPEGFDGKRAIEALKALPSVQPKPKTGHWIWDYGYATCNQCGYTRDSKDNEGQDIPDNYCPNCGARMEKTEQGLAYADQDTLQSAT